MFCFVIDDYDGEAHGWMLISFRGFFGRRIQTNVKAIEYHLEKKCMCRSAAGFHSLHPFPSSIRTRWRLFSHGQKKGLPNNINAASMTPVLRARMAMWLSTSTGDVVSTAFTPGGMSSRPPRLAERTTVGELE